MFTRFLVFLTGMSLCVACAFAQPPVTAIAFTPNGDSVVVAAQNSVRIVSWPQLDESSTLPSQIDKVHDLSFSPDGSTLAIVGGSPAEVGAIEFFSWPSARRLQTKVIGDDVLYGVAWQNNGKSIVVAGPDHSLLLLDRAGKTIAQIEGHSRDVVTVGVLNDEYLVSGSRDSTIRVWRSQSRELVRTLNNHTNQVHDIAVQQGRTSVPFVIASSSEDRTVRFWWPVRGRLMRFAKLPSPALDVEWTADGERLVAACADGHVRVIDPSTVQVTRDIEVTSGWLYALAIAPDGQFAIVGGTSGLLEAVSIR